tara:strand:+ start:16454 stop:17302 length:849 start_codon:yes stop_codon:yes gene_type:complete
MEKILITGINGFIGNELFSFLVKKKLNIFGTINSNKKKNNIIKKFNNKIINEKIFSINLLKKKEVTNLIKKIKPDIIFHFAGNTRKFKKYNNQYFITKNIVEAISKETLFVFPSTDKIYINSPKDNLENSKIINKFDNLYEKQKINCEKFIKKKLKKYFILRLGIVHSTGKIDYFKKSIIDQTLVNLKNKKKSIVFKNIYRSFCKINELNKFLLNFVIYKKNKDYGIYNIGSKNYSYFERVQKLARIKKLNINKIVPTLGNITPLKQELNTEKINKKGFFFS